LKFQSASSETAEVPTPSNTLSGIARILGRAIYATLLLTVVLAAALFSFTVWTEADHAPGTRFQSPFVAGGTR